MRILTPLRSDIKGSLVEEFSTTALAITLGNALSRAGVHVGYMGNVEPSRLDSRSVLYETNPLDPDMIQIARSLMTYREDRWDVLQLHTANFATFSQLRKYTGPEDRVVVTLHVPPNIGRSFYYHHQDLIAMLKLPNFRLVCVSNSGSYVPLKNFFGNNLPHGFERVVTIPNGVQHMQSIRAVPVSHKIDRFMFVAHLVPGKNVLKTLEVAVENRINCLFVGRRRPYKDNKVPKAEEEYAVRCEEYINANRDIIDYRHHLPYSECLTEMSRSRCLLVLSDNESFGLTPVEAALVGTPTIWLECQGINDTMIDGITGRMIPRRQYRTWKMRKSRAVELYQTITDLDQMPMFQHVYSNYLVSGMADKYQSLYSSVM